MKFRRSRHATGRWITAALGFLLALYGLALQSEGPVRAQPPKPRPTPHETPAEAWTELVEPRLAESPTNDGDSFVIAHRGGQHTLRLYFVDCCEKRRYDLVRSRIADQGAYFGGLSETQVIVLGREARDFTKQVLTTRPFRVHTRWERVFDSERFYAHLSVQAADGAWEPLPALLVRAGLARIHTKPADLPDGTRAQAEVGRLRELENEARAARRGGWKAAPVRFRE